MIDQIKRNIHGCVVKSGPKIDRLMSQVDMAPTPRWVRQQTLSQVDDH